MNPSHTETQLPVYGSHSEYEQSHPVEEAYERQKADARKAQKLVPLRSFPCSGLLREWGRDGDNLDVRCDQCGRELLVPSPKLIESNPDRFVEADRSEAA